MNQLLSRRAYHGLGAGTRQRLTDGTFEPLPADTGYLVGAEIGTFGFAPKASGFRRHLNLLLGIEGQSLCRVEGLLDRRQFHANSAPPPLRSPNSAHR